MKVKTLIDELSKVNPNFDVMISIGRKGERDLVEKVRNVECPNPSSFPDFGWVELESCNPIDWHYLTREDITSLHCKAEESGWRDASACKDCKNKCDEYHRWDKEMKNDSEI